MLEAEIGRLAKAIRAAVARYKETGGVPTHRRQRVRRRDLTLKYRPDFGFAYFTPVRTEDETWDWSDQQRFEDSVLKNLAEYASLVSSLGARAGLVPLFTRDLSFASFQGLSDDDLEARVSAFGREIAEEPLPVKVTAFIDGLSITESPLSVSDVFALRRPTEEDLAQDVAMDQYGGVSFPLGDAWFTVVGEFTFNAVSTGAAQKEFVRTLNALCLFRVGGVAASRYRMSSEHSFLYGGVSTLSSHSPSSQSSYTLSNPDAATLSRFVRDIAPLLPDPFDPNAGKVPREIALTRYRDALFHDVPSERAITSAITALEALFLKNEPELTHRLAQRVSVFLRALGAQADATRTYADVSKGYRIRSTFIHGGSLKPQDRPSADALSPILLEHARVCVLASFQIATPKEELLRQLDQTMIDPARVTDLQTTLAPAVHK